MPMKPVEFQLIFGWCFKVWWYSAFLFLSANPAYRPKPTTTSIVCEVNLVKLQYILLFPRCVTEGLYLLCIVHVIRNLKCHPSWCVSDSRQQGVLWWKPGLVMSWPWFECVGNQALCAVNSMFHYVLTCIGTRWMIVHMHPHTHTHTHTHTQTPQHTHTLNRQSSICGASLSLYLAVSH